MVKFTYFRRTLETFLRFYSNRTVNMVKERYLISNEKHLLSKVDKIVIINFKWVEKWFFLWIFFYFYQLFLTVSASLRVDIFILYENHFIGSMKEVIFVPYENRLIWKRREELFISNENRRIGGLRTWGSFWFCKSNL